MQSKVNERELVECLLRTFAGIQQDALRAYPKLGKGFKRDYLRILALVEHRGPSLFLLDLPHLDDLLTAGLRDEVYRTDGSALTRHRKKSSAIPRLFQELYLLVFNDDGRLKVDPDVNALVFLRELFCFAKKVEVECTDARVYETVESFYRVEKELPCSEHPYWDDPGAVVSPSYTILDYADLSVLQNCMEHGGGHLCVKGDDRLPDAKRLLAAIQYAFDDIAASLGNFNPEKYNFKHGPGAVSDLKGDFKNKYKFPSWSEKLEVVFPLSEFGFVNYNDWIDRNEEVAYSEDIFSRLIAVPKTFKGPRLIAAEPTSHQWCQQSVKDFISKRSATSWIGRFVKFNDQTLNQELALQGSLTGSLATVDLSEASDRVTTRLVERALRANNSLLRAVASCRTSILVQNIDKKCPDRIKLKKFSTMGSACTFPIETLLFLGIALGTCCYVRHGAYSERNRNQLVRSIAVYGDDIIVPTDCLDMIQHVLAFFSMKVNTRKTFGSGNFRESCGVDAFRGFDITPVRLKTAWSPNTPEDVASVLESTNNLFKKGFWFTSKALESVMGREYLFPLIGPSSGAVGLFTFTPCFPNRKRWNKLLCRTEYWISTFKSTVPRRDHDCMTALFQWFTERPLQDTQWASGLSGRPRLKIRSRWVPERDII